MAYLLVVAVGCNWQQNFQAQQPVVPVNSALPAVRVSDKNVHVPWYSTSFPVRKRPPVYIRDFPSDGENLWAGQPVWEYREEISAPDKGESEMPADSTPPALNVEVSPSKIFWDGEARWRKLFHLRPETCMSDTYRFDGWSLQSEVSTTVPLRHWGLECEESEK